MKLFITGASGFLGRYVVEEALRRGHSVRAVCRSKGAAAKLGWLDKPNLELAHVDLRSRKGLAEAVKGVDCVAHLAAAKAGDLYVQMAGTVVATENLLWAMDQAGDVRHLVHCSTFSVYDCLNIRSHALLDEQSPIEEDGFDRDEYAQTKVIQERLVREHATTHGWRLCVLRPGVIWGRDNLWSSRLGFQPSEKFWIRTGAWGQYPQTYVENCADAIVLACENRAADGQTLNVIDDEVPSQRQMVAMLRRRASPKPFVLPVNYSLLRFIAWSAWTFNGVFLKRRAKIPGLFVPARLHARLKPLKYTNKRVKDVLGWTPKYSIEQGIDRSLAAAGVSTSSDVQLRIAYMTGQYPRATDTFIQREVAALRERGVHVETLSVRRPGDKENVGPETQAERGRTTYLLPFRPLPLLKAHASALAASPKRYLKALKTALFVRPPGVKSLVWQLAYFAEAALVCAKVREQRLVHLHNHFSNSSCTVAMLAAEMGGFTFSFTMHGPNEFFEPDYWRLDEKLRRALFANCISHFCRSQGMIFSPAAKWERLHIVHCGVDPTAFSLVRHDGRGRNLLYVGRLADVKGLPVLIDAFAALRKDRPELTLTLAGDGPDRLELESRARDLGVTGSVRFLGYQSQAQVRALLQSTDVFVMASFAEGVPVVLMEAMAAGVPVVATRIAGIPELVEPGISGFLVPPGDPQTLAVRIGELLDDSALRSRFGAAGRAKVEREYDVRAEAGWLCEVLTEALAGRVAPVRRDGMTGLATPEKLPQVVASSS